MEDKRWLSVGGWLSAFHDKGRGRIVFVLGRMKKLNRDLQLKKQGGNRFLGKSGMKQLKMGFYGLAAVICPVLSFYLFEAYTHNPFETMTGEVRLLNMVFYWASMLFLWGIVRRLNWALMIQSGFFMVIGLVNFYVMRFRDTPIMPWDLLSASTAISVADNFDYTPDGRLIWVVGGFAALLLLESRCKAKLPNVPNKWFVRCVLSAVSLSVLVGFTAKVQDEQFRIEYRLYDKLFTPTVMNQMDGNVVAFLMEMEYLQIDKPESYSSDTTKGLLKKELPAQVSAAMSDSVIVRRPNIIVIMDEAFSDPNILLTGLTESRGKELTMEVNRDYMPFVHSLQSENKEDTITGYVNVSVLGGNTANSEFEFLTGNNMAFLPAGSVPYQQYVKHEMPSLPAYLNTLGYTSIAMHPYNRDGWERDRVYPILGFEEFLSLRDFAGADKLRNYVSDEADFAKIREIYEGKEENEPLFIFNVTMQNHSGYTEDFPDLDVDVNAIGADSDTLNRYLSLIRRSDAAFAELVHYFEQQEEDTMIVFFGDHQPSASVTNPILRANGIDPGSLTEEENLLRYQVPYVIWANFDIKEKSGADTSLNYLALDVLRNCGLPLNAYGSCLEEIRSQYPIVTGMQRSGIEGADINALERYQNLQYFALFDYEKWDETSPNAMSNTE
jgi:phosphoglycerol transferase MdoB-like AlkP superfamily enzyme